VTCGRSSGCANRDGPRTASAAGLAAVRSPRAAPSSRRTSRPARDDWSFRRYRTRSRPAVAEAPARISRSVCTEPHAQAGRHGARDRERRQATRGHGQRAWKRRSRLQRLLRRESKAPLARQVANCVGETDGPGGRGVSAPHRRQKNATQGGAQRFEKPTPDARAAPHEALISRKIVAEVPLTGLSFADAATPGHASAPGGMLLGQGEEALHVLGRAGRVSGGGKACAEPDRPWQSRPEHRPQRRVGWSRNCSLRSEGLQGPDTRRMWTS